ncbi:Centrosome and spindle pole associated protein 1 [Liparis tanakae]|uniref:Centrosome and spindle pole associated protein 1 n=1 Tax=Liparis tanakae TaxID=230148 RepID=A0A4Z2JF87_9TELE|nr:Centrosome and spindle pole associated protein 1 [Liparis tanakae]
MPPASAAHRTAPHPDRGLGLSSLLGNDYERKKKQLQQELKLEFKHYAAKIKDLKTSEPQAQGLSLPIEEKISVQPGQTQASDAVYISSPASPLPILNIHTNVRPPPREHPASRRDAATLTEAVDNGESTGTRDPGHRRRRRWQSPKPKEPYSSEEEPITDQEEELEFRHRRRQDGDTLEPEYREGRRTRERKANSRAPQGMKKMEAPGVRDQNNNEWVWKSKKHPASRRDAGPLTEAVDNGESTGTRGPGHRRRRQLPNPKEPYSSEEEPITGKEEELEFRHRRRQDGHTREPEYKEGRRTRERRTNRAPHGMKKMEAAGVHGAAEEHAVAQRRKEKYKQELLEQIAEQQRNKIREKQRELRVAPTGATGPGKQVQRMTGTASHSHLIHDPERRKQFGAINGQYDSWRRGVSQEDTEQRGPPGRTHVDSRTALSPLTEKTGTRAAHGVPSLHYLDEDYHRASSGMLAQVANPRRGPSRQNNAVSAPSLPACRATDQQGASPLDGGELPADKSQQKREKAMSYQKALRQQITEKEECKRREKEEKERYDVKLEADMRAYNPWGRSGGGASIKDEKGNLVSDLNQMHKTNEESYRNPVSKKSGLTQSFTMTDAHTPVVEGTAPLSHRLPGFSEKPTPQQLHVQDRYKEDLKRQIEDNKRKQKEEMERMRIEEEKEEKRLADQRACIQREYEKEQRKQKEMQHIKEKAAWIQKSKTPHQQEEKRVRQEEESEKKLPESDRDKEEEKEHLSYEGRSVSAPHSPPVPEKISPPQDGQQEVIRELSALRKYLRNEQRQLEVQLGQTDLQESHFTPSNRPRGRPRDAFESMHKQAVQPPTRAPLSGAGGVHNIREFVKLKYREVAIEVAIEGAIEVAIDLWVQYDQEVTGYKSRLLEYVPRYT